MATVQAENTNADRDVWIVTWSGMAGADVGQAMKIPSFSDKCVQIGALGGSTHGGATTVIQGSNDPAAASDPSNAKWFTLLDPQGNGISKTTDAIEQILENPLWIRPYQTGGSGGDLDIILVCKRTR